MTIKELYEYCAEKGAENYELSVGDWDGSYTCSFSVYDLTIDDKLKEVEI